LKSDLVRADYIRLLNEASVLAFSTESRARMLAYDIITHSLALRTKDQPALIHSVDFILSRLANFPGRRLLRQNHHATFDVNPGSAVSLVLEALMRERENTVDGFAHALTDFQLDFFRALETESAVSISAPTSAGKSFVLGQHIIRKMRAIPGCCVIYLVPTRALIREVMLRLRKELAESKLGGVAQRCVPLPATEEDTPHGLIYVLTQERLLSLLHVSADSFRMNLLVVDEAQGVRDGSRGVLLQTGIEQALSRCPKAEVVFASPLIRNPTRFLELFTHSRGHSALERHSPVGQNFILVESDPKAATQLSFSLLRQGRRVPLGSRDLSENFRKMGSLQQRATLSIAVTRENQSCLVYSNGPWEAEDLAGRLVQLRPTASVSQEVLDFIAYIEEHIHPEYPLIAALRRGVAFHHGEMPASVRGGVEDLFRLRKLYFICCTSTLLQGVNLPARHLVVDRPRRGNNKPLQPADFLNLAGRAGRLGREFNGNVWCLNASVWPNPPQDQTDLPEVEAAFLTTVHDEPERLIQVLDGNSNNLDRDGVVTASIGRLLTEYVFTGRLPVLPADESKRAELLRAIAAIKGLELRLPKHVFIRNSTVLPRTLERLYLSLLTKPDIDLWIPLHPHHEDFYHSLVRIFELLQTEVEERKGFGFRFDASLAVKWIRQWTLRRIIEARLEWQKKNGKTASPQAAIRSIIQAVEHRMRFDLVRSLRAYNDVMEVVLAARGRAADVETLRPLYLYVECGGFKKSLLSLMSLGFSRTSALILLDSLNVPDGLSPEQCRERILRINLGVAKIPELVQREVRQLLGSRIR
jgi:superfamily II DNA/RNA helicase